METFFGRYKNVLALALVLTLQVVLLAAQVRPRLSGVAAASGEGVHVLERGVQTVVTPPSAALHQGGLGFRNLWSSYVALVGVKEENERLISENQQLQLEEAALAEDARQGQRLQELLAFRQHYVGQTVPAQVVGGSGSDRERMLNLDKGADDGIAPGMPVITTDGIVGRIHDVTPHAAQVLLISDPTSVAGVLLEETRARGILRGDNVGHPQIVNLMPDDRIKPGQLVLTSGGDQVYPRGLPVGVVDKIVPDPDNQPLVDVRLKPAANLGRLEEVLVVTDTAPIPSERVRRDLARSEGAAAAIKAAAAQKAAEAAEAALEAQRASDILAARLPSASNVENPDAPDSAPGTSPATADSAAAPLHPPSALHVDQYSPNTAPKAADLTPGERTAPLAEGTPDTERRVQTPGAIAPPSPSVSQAFRAAHDAAVAARPHAKMPDSASSDAPPATTATRAGSVPAHPTAGNGPSPAALGKVLRPAAPTAQAGTPGAGKASRPAGVVPGAESAASTTARKPTPPATNKSTPPQEGGVPTQVVDDGPLPARKPPVANPGTAAPQKHTGPVLVPDDGSRPPQPAVQPTAPPPAPKEQR